MQRASLLRRVVGGMLEEQRVVEAEARGENQRDQVKQRQRDAAAAQRGRR